MRNLDELINRMIRVFVLTFLAGIVWAAVTIPVMIAVGSATGSMGGPVIVLIVSMVGMYLLFSTVFG